MTTTFMNTAGIPLHKFGGETYCKLIDVIHVIHHECLETNDKDLRRVLDRMEMRIAKNDFILPDAKKPTKLQPDKIPGRYAIGLMDKDGKWMFYADGNKDGVRYTYRPCEAKLYVNYRDASATADFLSEDFLTEDEPRADVLDFESNLTEEERWLRMMLIQFPFDADEGNEHAIPVQVVT